MRGGRPDPKESCQAQLKGWRCFRSPVKYAFYTRTTPAPAGQMFVAYGALAEGADFCGRFRSIGTKRACRRVTSGDISQGDDWYIGAMTDEQGRTLSVLLDSLAAGRDTRRVSIRTRPIRTSSVMARHWFGRPSAQAHALIVRPCGGGPETRAMIDVRSLRLAVARNGCGCACPLYRGANGIAAA